MNDMVSSRKTGAESSAVSGIDSECSSATAREEKSGQKHAIAVAEEAVLLLDGVTVGGKNALASSESTDEHEETGLREVEVGEHGVHQAKAMTGGEKDVCAAGVSCGQVGIGGEGAVLQRANDGGTDGDYAATIETRGMDGLGGFRRQGIRLAVEMDFCKALNTQWGKGSKTDVKGDGDDGDPAIGNGVEYLRSEVKAGSGRSDRAMRPGVDGLIAVAVSRGVGAVNIRRQGHVTDAVKSGEKVGNGNKTESALAKFSGGNNLGVKDRLIGCIGKDELIAGADFAPWANERAPVAVVMHLSEQDFDEAGGGLTVAQVGPTSEKTRGQDTAIVDDQQVAGVKNLGQIGKLAIGVKAGCAVEVKHPAGPALGGRLLSDESFRKIEVEVGDEQFGAVFGECHCPAPVIGEGRKYCSARFRARSMD